MAQVAASALSCDRKGGRRERPIPKERTVAPIDRQLT